MIMNPIVVGSGVKKVTINPAGTSAVITQNTYGTPTFTFSGLASETIKSGCIAAVITGSNDYGLLFIKKSGEVTFTNSGICNFTVAQPYNPQNGTCVMTSNVINTGRVAFIIVLE